MAQEKLNPGIWIGAAILCAAVIVAVSIPGKKADETVKPARTEEGKTTKAGEVPLVAPTQAGAPAPAPKETPSKVAGNGVGKPPMVTAPDPGRAPEVVSRPPVVSAPGVTVPAPAGNSVPEATKPTAGPISREVAEAALDNVQFALRDFRTALGGNPVGNNAEITSALLGQNKKQLALPQPEGSAVNAAGELCDPWGTPYFFHQQSGTVMEVRSAGPDKRMWTNDDVQM